MLVHPQFDPVAIHLGPLAVRWYGLMYVVGFAVGWWLGRRRASQPGSSWTAVDVDDAIFFAALGVIVGGRVGWVLFYGFTEFMRDPVMLLRIWEGGMSFHGGLLGVLAAGWCFLSR